MFILLQSRDTGLPGRRAFGALHSEAETARERKFSYSSLRRLFALFSPHRQTRQHPHSKPRDEGRSDCHQRISPDSPGRVTYKVLSGVAALFGGTLGYFHAVSERVCYC
jgi:hypothetical protein